MNNPPAKHAACAVSRTLILAVLCILGAVRSATAEEAGVQRDSPDYWSLQIENDFFAASGDRYYTHGFEVSRLQANGGPEWLKRFALWFPMYEMADEEPAVTYSFGQRIFTPKDKKTALVVPGDRPYAGYLYGSAAVYSRVRTIDCLRVGNKFEITIGVVGPSSGADHTQKFFHELIGNDVPQGWDNQLRDEAAFGVSYSRFWSIVQPGPWSLQFGVNPHMSGEIGNVYTYGAGGVMFRLGTNLWRDFNPPSIRPGFPGISYFEPGEGRSWYVFFGHESRIVARDIFLDGNTLEKKHWVDKERLVGDYQFGVTYRKDKVRFALSNMVRTKEFKTQEDLTRYGAINVSMVF